MANGIEETITTLYEMVQDAWSLPLGAEKCVVERDKVLDLLDEISNQLPGELKQAKTIVESRNEVITNAKREAENILKQAEQRAKQMISREEVVKQAEQQAAEMMKAAQQKIKELRQVTNDYVDDAMKRTEDAISQSLSEIRESRSAAAWSEIWLALPRRPTCAGSGSYRFRQRFCRRSTPRSAARRRSIFRRAKISSAHSASRLWSSATRTLCPRSPTPFSTTAAPR